MNNRLDFGSYIKTCPYSEFEKLNEDEKSLAFVWMQALIKQAEDYASEKVSWWHEEKQKAKALLEENIYLKGGKGE